MHKLKLMAALAAMMVASPALAQEITVWDVNVTNQHMRPTTITRRPRSRPRIREQL